MPLYNPPGAGSHPDLATHDALGLATDAELSAHDHDADYEATGAVATHAGLADPHTGYVQEADANWTDLTDGGATTLHSHAGGTWTTIIKPADTARTNNTVSADPDLVATLVANTNYVLRFRVFLLTNATADSRYQLTFSGTTTRVRRQIVRTATADVPALIAIGTAFDAAPVVLSTTGLNPYVEEMVILQVGASGGTFAFQWAQVTTNGSPCTVLEGSFLEYAVT